MLLKNNDQTPRKHSVKLEGIVIKVWIFSNPVMYPHKKANVHQLKMLTGSESNWVIVKQLGNYV